MRVSLLADQSCLTRAAASLLVKNNIMHVGLRSHTQNLSPKGIACSLMRATWLTLAATCPSIWLMRISCSIAKPAREVRADSIVPQSLPGLVVP